MIEKLDQYSKFPPIFISQHHKILVDRESILFDTYILRNFEPDDNMNTYVIVLEKKYYPFIRFLLNIIKRKEVK